MNVNGTFTTVESEFFSSFYGIILRLAFGFINVVRIVRMGVLLLMVEKDEIFESAVVLARRYNRDVNFSLFTMECCVCVGTKDEFRWTTSDFSQLPLSPAVKYDRSAFMT